MTVNKKLISDIAVYTLLIISLGMLFSQLSDKKHGIRIAASDIMQPIAEKIKNTYSNNNKQLVSIQKEKSGNILNQVLSGKADIGFLSGNITDTDQFGQISLGSDALVIIVNTDNPLNSINKNSLLDIYTKKTDNWKDFSSMDKPILVVSEQAGNDLSELFNQYSGLKNPGESKGTNGNITTDTHITGSEMESISFVGRNKGAIGFTSLSAARYLKYQGVPIKIVTLDGINPYKGNIIDSKYPVKFSFLMIFKKNNPEIKNYLDFISTPQAQKLIKEPRFINTDISE